MSETSDNLQQLKQRLSRRVEKKDPQETSGFITRFHETRSCLLAEWDGKGKTWARMTDDLEVTSPKTGVTQTLKSRALYHYEVMMFFVAANGQPAAWPATGLEWEDQRQSTFVALARVSQEGRHLSGWTPFGDGPGYMSAQDTADDIGRYVKKVKRARRSGFGLGLAAALLLVGAFGYGSFEYLRSNPDVLQDGLDRIDFDVKLPDLPKRPDSEGPGPSEPEASTGGADEERADATRSDPPASIADQERLDELERELGEARARNQELDSELERKDRELAARRKDLAHVRTAKGLSLPPCWPDESGTYTEFIYDVHVSDAGIRVTKVYPAHRDADYRDLPVSDSALGIDHDRASFIAAFRDLYELSKTQNCRHYVHLHEGAHAQLETYKIQRDTVEGYFYIHRPVWNK